ncbi:hypothetical protein FRC02_004206 [Tulasnella sp. 418]|nr:hypothetical protein FRC02_004206 [Tulasnella sp. 418]
MSLQDIRALFEPFRAPKSLKNQIRNNEEIVGRLRGGGCTFILLRACCCLYTIGISECLLACFGSQNTRNRRRHRHSNHQGPTYPSAYTTPWMAGGAVGSGGGGGGGGF